MAPGGTSAEVSTAGGAPPPGTLAGTLAHAKAAGFKAADLRKFFAEAQVSPVLTAHPTEVMRKSMIDHRTRIAELMRQRDLGRDETPDGDVIEHEEAEAQVAVGSVAVLGFAAGALVAADAVAAGEADHFLG